MICDSKQVLAKARRWRVARIATGILANMLFVFLMAEIIMPGARPTPPVQSFLAVAIIIEVLYAIALWRNKRDRIATSSIVILVWIILIAWETASTKLGISNPVLFPTPEAVFNVYPTQWPVLLENMAASGSLLLMGAVTAIAAGVILGAICGWLSALESVFAPIARVLAPIPSVVFAPYIILLTPTFRVASATIIFLGLFWPTFLTSIVRVKTMDKRIIESARMLGLSSFQMIKDIILPYLIPGIMNGLNGQLTAAITMLTFAEMLGAKAGLGYYIINYTNFANYVNVIAGIILVAVLVTILNCLINLAKDKLVKWS